MMSRKAMTGTQAIDRAAQLLVLVVENESSSSVGELAEAAGLPKSTVSRAVSALERQGLVQRSSARGSIRPGPVLLGLARRGGTEQYIAQVDSRHILGTTNWVGRRLPHHCTAVGKVLVAFGAARLQRGALERLTPDTITDRDALSAELDTVRACGYATAVGELEPGLVALAAPVLDADGRAVAAISISGPQFRIPSDRLDGFGKLLTKETETLSARLGFRPAGEGAA